MLSLKNLLVNKCLDNINVKAFFVNSICMNLRVSFLILVAFTFFSGVIAQPKVIIKLDDIYVKNGAFVTATGGVSGAPQPAFDTLLNRKIKAAIGVVSSRCDVSLLSKLTPYLNARNISGDKLFEVWHHGFDHLNPEFGGTSYTYQKWHFDSANTVINRYLNLQMHTFGAPFNASDAVTNTVISENTNYKVTMFNDVNPAASTGILNLTNRNYLESATGVASYNYFIDHYTNYTDYFVLQGHPSAWSANSVLEFTRIIDTLLARGCSFVLPYEYYLSLNPLIPVAGTSQSISFTALSNKFVGDADFDAGATTSSGLPITFISSNTSVATIVAGKIHIVGPGTVTITASQAGNSTYQSADYVSQMLSVNANAFRSAVSSGNWQTLATWQSRDRNGNWATATSLPTATDNVYIQNGHTVIVNTSEAYCNDLHINSSGTLTISSTFNMQVNGKIRAYTGSAITSTIDDIYTGTSTTTLASTMIATSSTGVLKFVGNTRNITNSGEWSGASTTNNVEFALDASAIGTLATAIKFRTITISSGTVSAISSINSSATGTLVALVIKNGAKLTSSRTYTTGGSQVVTSSSTTKCGVVQIDNGSILELTGANPVIDCTTFTNNGTVVYSGASVQKLLNTGAGSGVALSAYNNLTINSAVADTLVTDITVAGILSITNGKLVTANYTTAFNITLSGTAVLAPNTFLEIKGGTTNFNSRSVTLQSSADGTASIGNIIGGLINATNVTVECFIPSNNRKQYTLIGSPVTSTINAGWQETNATVANYGTHITGGVTQGINGFDGPSTSRASIFYYDDTKLAGTKWTALTSTLTAASIAPTKGYLVFVRGDRSENRPATANSSNTTLRATGILGQGAISPTLLATAYKYTLIANPYPCAIDWNSAGITKTNLTGNFTVYDANNGVFVSSNGTNKSPNIGNQQASYIQSGQAFFVQAASTATTAITFTEAAKTTLATTTSTVFGNHEQAQLNINAYHTADNSFADGVVAIFDAKYKAAVDAQDITKFTNLNETLGLLRDGTDLGLEARPIPTTGDYLSITLSNFSKKNYRFVIDGTNFNNATATLEDQYTDTKTRLDLNGSTTCNFTVNNDVESSSNKRFKIVFGSTPASTIVADNLVGSLYVKMSPNPAVNQLLVSFKTATAETTIINVINSLGELVKTVNVGTVNTGNISVPVSTLASGLYSVQLISGGKVISTQQVIIQQK